MVIEAKGDAVSVGPFIVAVPCYWMIGIVVLVCSEDEQLLFLTSHAREEAQHIVPCLNTCGMCAVANERTFVWRG